MKDVESLRNQLVDEYSKTIDSSTLLAILSDYDISNPEELDLARQTLDVLKDAVPDEEATGFDASGASGPGLLIEGIDATENESRSGSGGSLPMWTSQNSQTDATSLGQGMSLLDLEGLDFAAHTAPSSRDESPEKSYTSELDGLDSLEKEHALMGIFPILTPFDVRWTLKKYKGNTSLAIDELMTQSFLEENGSRHKGIEAFSESEIPSKPRKGKKKKTRIAIDTNGGTVLEPPSQSKWTTAKKDIQFIVSTTGMSGQQAGSLYHKNNASIKATIQALIEAHQAMNLDTDDPMTQINAYELRQDFPAISTPNLETIVELTGPSLANARSLAERLTSSSSSGKNPIQLEFRHAPIDLSSNEPSPVTQTSRMSFAQDHPLGSATSYTRSRNSAFSKAATYYRQGKSDHLMGGAAAYYAEEGRSYDVLARKALSAQADSLVASQSSRTELDLHGVNVKDALRISRERVTGWWHDLGENKAAGNYGGYRIVTGVGKHSEGGRGKLGPAVGKMLIREGWKVEVGSGSLVVRGVSSPSRRR